MEKERGLEKGFGTGRRREKGGKNKKNKRLPFVMR